MRKALFVVIISIVLCTSVLNILPLNCSSNPIGWSGDIRLTNSTNSSTLPVIGVWENYVHVFWCEREPEPPTTTRDIYYKRSSDGGKTWKSSSKLIDTPYNSINPSIAINESTIHMVWRDDRNILTAIYYTRSKDNGTTWIPEVNISTPNAGTDKADIAIWEDKIYVVYMDYTYGINGFQLYFIKSEDNGNTWSTPQNITSEIRDSNNPRIAVNGTNIHVVWLDHYDKDGNMQYGDIFYMNSPDKGLTWNEEINLTPLGNNPLDSAAPDIVVNGSILHVTYSDDRYDSTWRVHYRRSEDNGITWSDDITLSEPESIVSSSKIASYDNNLHVVWGDERDGNKEIYYKSSADNGDTWSEDIRLTFDNAGSVTPSVTTRENKADVVWRDDRNSIEDIYYKHYPIPFSPTNLTVDIWGTNLLLNWAAPQNSPSPVDHYYIYRSTTLDGFDFSSPWVDTSIDFDNGIIPLRISWNHTGAALPGHGNYSEQWYYCIRAIDVDGWNDTNTNIVGKYDIPMKKGWNMISLPLVQINTSISKVLQTIDGNYDVIWTYDSKENRWRSSTNDLTEINRTMGLWIHMKNICYLSVVGVVPESTDITLYEGWNLVGYPSLKTRNLSDALNGISWTTVWTYDVFDINDLWKVNNTSKPTQLNDLEEMKPGCGYWVYVTINDTWVRTRVGEDNKVVVWRVPRLEEKESYLSNYKSIVENPVETEKEDSCTTDIAPTKSINKNEERGIDISLIPLVILFVLIFVEVKLLYKRKK